MKKSWRMPNTLIFWIVDFEVRGLLPENSAPQQRAIIRGNVHQRDPSLFWTRHFQMSDKSIWSQSGIL